jgi:YidC/Oxa1 family membrane protein insertase
MDKKSALALVLIFLVLLLWGPYMKLVSPPQKETKPAKEQIPPPSKEETLKRAEIQPAKVDSVLPISRLSQVGSLQQSNRNKKLITVETPRYKGVLSTKGGTIEEWYLKEYKSANDSTVNIIRTNKFGNLANSFQSTEGFEVNLNDFDFIPENVPPAPDSSYKIELSELPFSMVLSANLGKNRFVKKELTFNPKNLEILLKITFENCQSLIKDNTYLIRWGSGIRTSEANIEDDMRFSKVLALYGSDIEKFDVQNAAAKTERPLIGDVHWVAAKSKYFCALIIPRETPGTNLLISGTSSLSEMAIGRKNYVSALSMPFTTSLPAVSHSFLVYLGPIDYTVFKKFDKETGKELHLKEMLDINKYIRDLSAGIYWIFSFLHSFIPNYGVVIIVFALIINFLLYPLTAKSYKSMKRMSQIQPLMQEINEKYKNEPKKKQEAIVRLYKEHKVNPLGGCLPILFQMPVFFAIYPIFRAIELRGAPFIWWIKDLSCPDTVATLPTAIPFYGNQVNVLPILYAISLFVQQKIMVKDPKQKAMVYIMPIFLLLLLNKWSSGFILYWFIFNLLSILQRYIVKDKEEPKPETSHAPLPVKSLVNKFSKKSKK